MLNWLWPNAFYLLPLPWLIRWLMPAIDNARGAIRVPFFQNLQDLADQQQRHSGFAWFSALLCALIWISLVTAVARPTWVGDPVNLPQERRDLMLAVDISMSMQEEDMRLNGRYVARITAVKAVVKEFIEQRSGDRLGLILFGQQGYLQTPLTYDSKTVQQQLLEAQLGFAGNATAIGDTIGLAIKKLRDRPAQNRVLILLTDGANTAGSDPLSAARVAAEAGVRIHTISIGADVRTRRDIFGRSSNISRAAEIDEETLITIAKQTGGEYFRARNPDELRDIYQRIDELEPIPEDQTFRPTLSLTYWFVVAALILSGLMAIITARKGR